MSRIHRYCPLLFSLLMCRPAGATTMHLSGNPANTVESTLTRASAENKIARKFSSTQISYRQGDLLFEWDLQQDNARLLHLPNRSVVWKGSLLPSFWLVVNHKKEFVKASLAEANGPAAIDTTAATLQVSLQIGKLGRGRIVIDKEDWGIRFSALEINWTGTPPAIVEMYFGASDKALKNSLVLPGWERPFLPDWEAFGYCVPGAKEGPAQSYFRSWDFGLTNIALGSFGPSMGVPYGAAYPKPLYFAGMGSDEGFIALGAGAIPDAAMFLRVRATHGCFQYVYDEDLWGALPARKRVWEQPLRISFGPTALAAFKNYYRSLPARIPDPGWSPTAFFNTWGVWRENKYTIAPIAAFAKTLGTTQIVLDDGWESAQGTGEPNRKRFPALDADLAAIRDSGMTYGIWETLGWIDDTTAAGLTSADLIVGRNGWPCKANWNFDPSSSSYFCLDISSPKSREFLKQRTIREMRTLKPKLIKLDFGYGFPSPDMGTPRNPLFRGERQSVEFVRLIAATAKSIDPSVKIIYYGISPLVTDAVDIVSLDDQGDLWYDIAGGHGEWSIWSTLLSDKGVAIAGSSGYDWEPDEEVILNTAIIGCPGATLPIAQPDGRPIREKYLNRRLAIDTWFRRTLFWQPRWLNSRTGNFKGPPQLNCWGRIEKIGEDSLLTALALRDGSRSEGLQDSAIRTLRWKGRWALISQDAKDIFSTSRLALIPFDAGEMVIPCAEKPAAITRLSLSGETAYDQWEWSNGLLKIEMTEEMLEKTAGLLVRRQ